ncbi:potassium-transporting ATPase subunit KdpA [Bacillus cytotoxicus]|uniref:Potassium-transporting ATPase potassium-binding subunit n=1 Tax=Bacillus cytotoxicus TaxID=580165 RepID=A0AAX2CDG5_9BACI|nr:MULTISPECIES: potassium-transporting ATPase subunit KdpA [Bacillus cereus group]QTR71759.1 potassium-transporting ATPase subunit A [Bacillus cytotoxicus]QTR83347.1 potassium-transporting ATPase subunit A [Bacillus cytotoxicus]QTR87084.1 potassium-transporting ATPase subunit A [Bacillus cytotoxicus]SCL85209.1 Potassium-transporting ATPase A chain [Bacillus cytotoxicus]HDR4572602.1 potassium-transporting ATPase subunit A [Bacillus cytotoxicus]
MVTWVAAIVTIVLFILLAKPMGTYVEKAFQGSRTLEKVFGPIESIIFKVGGIQKKNQTWIQYVFAMLFTNACMILFVYLVFRLQGVLPLNPSKVEGMEPTLAFHTAISFMTNTNLQHYSGESGLSYLAQMIGITFMMFTAPATTLAFAIAFIRGLAGKEVGNFFVDFVRAIIRVLMPIAFIMALIFVAQGMPQTLSGSAVAQTLEGAKQVIPRGPIASLESIKMLGNNGGGFFGVNSAHPFENPTAITNVLQMMLMMFITTSLPFTYGRMIGSKKQGRILFVSMLIMFVIGFGMAVTTELQGNPVLNQFGMDHAQGNMEGKEVRFGTIMTALFATVTTASETGGVNAMHDTFTPLGGMLTLVNMLLNTVFGGVGAGFINVIMYAMIAVFISGLMVGRTPEFLGKKLEGKEMKLIAVTLLFQPLLILGASAVAFSTNFGAEAITNSGFHGITQVIYEFTSSAANNGSGFEGLADNTPFWNISTGLVMYGARFFSLVTMLAVSVSLKEKAVVPETVGTFRTDNGLFGGIFVGTIFIVGALTFFPVLVLGPIAEFLTL